MKKSSFFLLYLILFTWLAQGSIYAIVTHNILLNATDQLAVNAYYEFDDPVPIEFPIFTASVYKQDVHIQWSTLPGLNNLGFEIERAQRPGDEWVYLGFVEGRRTANQAGYYQFWDYNVPVGSHSYRYKQIDSNGSFIYSNTLEIDIYPPGEFVLFQNYPNPFNPVTVIRYQIPDAGYVKLIVYNMLGTQVEKLVDGYQEPGGYFVTFNNDELASGIYVYALQWEGKMFTRKMVVLK